MSVRANLKLKLMAQFVGSCLVLMLAIGMTGCQKSVATVVDQALNSPQIEALTTTQGPLSEVNIPIGITKLAPSLERFQPQVQILSPQAGEVLNDDRVTVKIQVKGLPIFKSQELGLGNHLDVILDQQTYQGVYDLAQPLVFKNLAAGTHTLRVFASRPWHESFKNPGAYAQTTFDVLTKTAENNPDPQQPLLTYSRPTGTYGAEPIMLDYYLTNAPVHSVEGGSASIPDWKIRATVNNQQFMIDRWSPVYLQGFKVGKNWVRLELVDDRGTPIPNVYNDTVGIVTYDPGLNDTLSKLTRGELSDDLSRSLVDPNYVVIKPTPPPAPTPVIVPAPAISTPPVIPSAPIPSPVIVPIPQPIVIPAPAIVTAPKSIPVPSTPAIQIPSPTPIIIPTPAPVVVQPIPTPSPIVVPAPIPVAKASPAPIVVEQPQPIAKIAPSPVVEQPQPIAKIAPSPVVVTPTPIARVNPPPVVPNPQPLEASPPPMVETPSPAPIVVLPSPTPAPTQIAPAAPVMRSTPIVTPASPAPISVSPVPKIATPPPTQQPFIPATTIPAPELKPQTPVPPSINPEVKEQIEQTWQDKAIELIQIAGVKTRAFTHTIPDKSQRFSHNVQIFAGNVWDTIQSWRTSPPAPLRSGEGSKTSLRFGEQE